MEYTVLRTTVGGVPLRRLVDSEGRGWMLLEELQQLKRLARRRARLTDRDVAKLLTLMLNGRSVEDEPAMREPDIGSHEVARMIGKSTTTTRAWMRQGVIPSWRMDGDYRTLASIVRAEFPQGNGDAH